MTRKVRWGIVSAGTIAHTFAADMAHVSNAELTAVATRDLQAATRFAARYEIATAYEGYAALYADADIDAIYVATPHTLHFENSADALRSGKAVLCEKPLSVSARECQDLLDIAAATDGYLMEAMWTWFLPAVRQARAWVADGRIGELRHVRAELGYPKKYDPLARVYDVSLAGGCLLDLGIYPIAIARLFTARAPRDIHVISRHAPNGVDDYVAILFDYDDCVASIATSFRCKLPNAAYIIGTDGYIQIPDCWSARQCHLFVLDDKIESFVDQRNGSGFEYQIAAVSDDILRGRRQSAIVTHAASLAFQQDTDRVRERFGSQATLHSTSR